MLCQLRRYAAACTLSVMHPLVKVVCGLLVGVSTIAPAWAADPAADAANIRAHMSYLANYLLQGRAAGTAPAPIGTHSWQSTTTSRPTI